MYRSFIIVLALLVVVGVIAWQVWFWWPGAVAEQRTDPTISDANLVSEYTPPSVRFTDITEEAKIKFQHVNGSYGKRLLPETMGPGVAFLDYDKDDKQDILFVNSCDWPGQAVNKDNP